MSDIHENDRDHVTASASAATDWTVREGTPVITFDGEKIGEVENATGGYLLVKKGFLFPKEYAIPAAAIENVGPDAVYLNVTKDIARSQGWDEPLTPETASGEAQALPITPAAAPPAQVVTGEPPVEPAAPLIGTFTDDQAGTYTDAAAGTETVDPAETLRTRDDALLETATSTAGFGADDAEEVLANPIDTNAIPASPDQEVPMSARESDSQNTRDAALAGHDEALDEGIDTPHTLRTPSPLPAMDAPLSADEPAPADGNPEDAGQIATDAALENEALDPLVSEDAEADPDPELPSPSGPADRV